jgi:hemolysin III
MKVSVSPKLLPVAWDYDRSELVADAVVHILGIVLAFAGAAGLIAALVAVGNVARLPSVTIYLGALVSMLGFSAAYNLWPVSELKWWLRRLDHSAIYLLIAATYTAFLSPMQGAAPAGALAAIWSAALAGMAIKLIWPGRFDRTSVALYLVLGWSGIFMIGPVTAALTPMLFSCGVIFHAWRGLRFQNAIWHGFVLGAAVCHYGAVLSSLVA